MTAQVVTITEPVRIGSGVDKISWDWASTDGGAVVGSASTDYYTGIIACIEMIPDAATTTPTAAYTLTLKDDNGVDLLHGLGVGSATATATVAKVFGDGLGIAVNTKLTMAVAAAGDAKGGILNVYILPL